MSHLKPVRLVGALLAVAGLAAVTTAGIALAQGGHRRATPVRSRHAAKASGAGTACPAPSGAKSAQRPGAVAVPGSAGEKEVRAQKEALAAKAPAEGEGAAEKAGPSDETQTPAEQATRAEKERLVAARPPCQVGSGAAAERGSREAALRG
jgi:hypothetical protein